MNEMLNKRKAWCAGHANAPRRGKFEMGQDLALLRRGRSTADASAMTMSLRLPLNFNKNNKLF
jgi:hypothetical protein